MLYRFTVKRHSSVTAIVLRVRKPLLHELLLDITTSLLKSSLSRCVCLSIASQGHPLQSAFMTKFGMTILEIVALFESLKLVFVMLL